jgi:hypothetical protein
MWCFFGPSFRPILVRWLKFWLHGLRVLTWAGRDVHTGLRYQLIFHLIINLFVVRHVQPIHICKKKNNLFIFSTASRLILPIRLPH